MVPVRQDRRAGFTLIELLVVIGIIALLAALTTAAIMKFLVAQPTTSTRTELKSLQTAFNQKWMQVTDQAAKKEESIRAPYESQLMGLAGNQPDRMRVIWVKIRQQQAFPQTFYEALNKSGPIGIPALSSYKAYLAKYGILPANYTNPNAVPQPYESAVCLLMALRRNVSGGGAMSEDTFGVGTFVTQITDPTNPSMLPTPCLVDAWKRPLLFARWPTGGTMLTPPAAGDPVDPSDPQNLLAGLTGANLKSFQNSLHRVWSKQSTKLVPLIASIGADGKPGLLLAPSPGTKKCWAIDPANPNDATDNIYSNNLP